MGLTTRYIKFIDVNAGGSTEPEPPTGFIVWAKTNVDSDVASGTVTDSSDSSHKLTVTGTTYKPLTNVNGSVKLTYSEGDDYIFDSWYKYPLQTSDIGGIKLVSPMPGTPYTLNITGTTYLSCNFTYNYSIRIYTAFYNTFTDKNNIKYVNSNGAVAISNNGSKTSSMTSVKRSDVTIGYVNEIPDFVVFKKWMYTSGIKTLTTGATPISNFSDVDWQTATGSTLTNLPSVSSTIIALFDYTASNTDAIIPTLVVNLLPTIEEGGIPSKTGGHIEIRNGLTSTEHTIPKPSATDRVYDMVYSTKKESMEIGIDAYPNLGYMIDKVSINNEPADDLIPGRISLGSFEPIYGGMYTLNEFSNLRVLFKPSDKMVKVNVYAQYSEDYFKISTGITFPPLETIEISNTYFKVSPYSSYSDKVYSWEGYANTTPISIEAGGSRYAMIGYALRFYYANTPITVENFDFDSIANDFLHPEKIKITCDTNTDFILRCIKNKEYSIDGYAYLGNSDTLNPIFGTITLTFKDQTSTSSNNAAEINVSHLDAPNDVTVTIKATPPDGAKVKEMYYRKPGESSLIKNNLSYTLNGSVATATLTTSYIDSTPTDWKVYAIFEVSDTSKWKNVKVQVYQIKGKNGTETYDNPYKDVDGIHKFEPNTTRNYSARTYEYDGFIPKDGFNFELSLLYSSYSGCDCNVLGYWVNGTYNEHPQEGSIFKTYTLNLTGNTTIKVVCEPKEAEVKIPFNVRAYPVLGNDGLTVSTVGGNITSMNPGTFSRQMWQYNSDGSGQSFDFEIAANPGYQLSKFTVNGNSKGTNTTIYMSKNSGDSIIRCHFVPVAGIKIQYSIVVLPVSYSNYRSIEPNTTVGTVTMSQPTPNMTGLSTGMYGKDGIEEGTSTSVRVTASANSGYTFKGWTVNYEGDDVDSNYASTSTTFNTTVTNSTVLRAVFKAN